MSVKSDKKEDGKVEERKLGNSSNDANGEEESEESEEESVFPESHIFMKICFPLQMCFCWVYPLLLRGLIKPLRFDNLYSIDNTDYNCTAYEKRFKKFWKFYKFLSWIRLRLAITLYSCFFLEYAGSGLLKLFGTILVAIYPQFLKQFLLCLKPLLTNEKQDDIDSSALLVPLDMRPTQSFLDENYRSNDYEIWLWFIALVVVQTVAYITQNYSYFIGCRVGAKMRVILMDQIYKKTFSMSNDGRENRDKGEILNFLAYDCYRIDDGHVHVHEIWTSVIHFGVSAYFIVDMMGLEMFFTWIIFGILMTLMCIGFLGIFIFRSLSLKAADKRISYMKETFLHILQVKFFNREKIQLQKINKYRRYEIAFLRALYAFRSLVMTVTYSTPLFMILSSFMIYYYVQGKIENIVLLTSITYFTMLRQPIGSISFCAASYTHALAAMRRIQNFLEEKDRPSSSISDSDDDKSTKNKSEKLPVQIDQNSEYSVEIKGDFHFPVRNNEINFRLDNIDVKINKGDLVLVIGCTRSGKTALARTILGETDPCEPNSDSFVKLNTRKISYCDQAVWLENDTVLNNILMCDPSEIVDKKRLSDVLKVCSLEDEVKKFKGGIHLEIGDNSATLSGGQKSRIALSRAVYYMGDIFILDNSLSSLDEFVGNHVFQYCILRYLREKTRILITNKWEFLPYADKIIVMEDGVIVEQGTYEELFFDRPGKLREITSGQEFERDDPTKYDLEELLFEGTKIEELKSPITSPMGRNQVLDEIFERAKHSIETKRKKKKKEKKKKKKKEEEEEEKEEEEIEGESESESEEEEEEETILSPMQIGSHERDVFEIEIEKMRQKSIKKKEEEKVEEREEEEDDGSDSGDKGDEIFEEIDLEDEDLLRDEEETTVQISSSEERVTGFIHPKTFITFISHTGCIVVPYYRRNCKNMCCSCSCGCLVIALIISLYIALVINYFANEIHMGYVSKNGMYMRKFGNFYESTTCNFSTDAFDEYKYCDISESHTYENIIYTNDTVNLTGIHNETKIIYVDLVVEPVEMFWDMNYQNKTVIRPGLTEQAAFGVYGGLLFIFVFILFLVTNCSLNTFLNTSNRLFHSVIDGLFSTSMSFFYANPTGRILSRVSYDVSRTDYDLIMRIDGMVIMSFLVLGAFGQLILSTYGIFLPILIVVLIVLFCIYFCFRKNTIELKRLESISRSSIFHTFHQTLEGLSTIRSFPGYSDRLTSALEDSINRQTRASIPLKALVYMLRSNLTIAGTGMVCVVCFFSILFSYYVPIEGLHTLLGLGIVNVVLVVDIVGIVFANVMWFEIEMNSTERLDYYISELGHIEREKRKESKRMKKEKSKSEDGVVGEENERKEWIKLERGEIELRNFSARYKKEFPYILKNLNIIFKEGSKVLIVGTTGCGKSSLFNALLGIFEEYNIEGDILLDGKLHKNLNIRSVRREISIVPQDPILFTGTLLDNLDPSGKFDEKDVKEIIKLCGLKKTVDRIPGKLNGIMLEHGKNFSVGEKRLFCLARALVKKSKVILLDECTGIDYSLDQRTQEVVCALENVTVLSISHRLANLVYYDNVLVMDQGEVREFGKVNEIIEDEDSCLRGLLRNVPNGRWILRTLRRKNRESEEADDTDSSDGQREERKEKEMMVDTPDMTRNFGIRGDNALLREIAKRNLRRDIEMGLLNEEKEKEEEEEEESEGESDEIKVEEMSGSDSDENESKSEGEEKEEEDDGEGSTDDDNDIDVALSTENGK